MVSTLLYCLSLTSSRDQRFMVNGHCHSFAYILILESRIVEVEDHGFKVRSCWIRCKFIALECLVCTRLAYIKEPGRGNTICLQVIENGILIAYGAENNFIQIRQSFRCAVVVWI